MKPAIEPDIRQRKKEGFLIVAILTLVGLLTFFETRINVFDSDFPVSNTVLMFILINTNLLLLLTLILLVFRNLVKLTYERRNRILGSKLKTKLVAAFVSLALLPTVVLFFFAIHFISTSIAFWFNAPVEQTLESSLSVGRQLYDQVEENNLFIASRAAYQIHSRKLLAPDKKKELERYIQVVQRAFNLHAVEVYTPDAKRSTVSAASELAADLDVLTSDNLTRIPEDRKARTVSQVLQAGEIIRSIATVPFGVDPAEAQAFIVTSSLIPADVSANLAAISQGAEEYEQLKMIKKPVQTSTYIALSIVALLVIFCAVWFGFYLARTITIPIIKLAEGTQRVTEGDLNHTIDIQSDDEIGTLITYFNSMTRKLAENRQQLALSGQMMQRQNEEIEKSRKYMEIVLKNISAGVISISDTGTITTINKSAETMLGLRAKTALGNSYQDAFSGDLQAIAETIGNPTSVAAGSVEFPLSVTIDGSPRYFSMHYNSLKSDSDEALGAVLVFDDLTQLEKAQRAAAWREVARRIAHEVKNPLTPIKLSAQRLKRKYSRQIDEEVFDKCTDVIVEHVDLIRNLVNDFSVFAKFPESNTAMCRIEDVIEQTVALYRQGLENVDIQTSYSKNIPDVNIDRQQMKQAFINLLDNAVAAINKHGTITLDTTFDAILNLVRIEIADDGKGISDTEKTRLFEPYFSTKKSGMGLGLAIVNSIINDHKGMIQVIDNRPRGARFIIELPV